MRGPEVGRLAGKPAAVARVVHVLAAPEIRGVGGPRVGVHHFGHETLGVGAEDERRCAGRRRVLEGVARGALRGVGADTHRVLDLAGFDQRLGHEHALGPRLAGELEIGDVDRGGRTDGLGDNGARRFDRVGVRLGTDVERADIARVDTSGTGEGVAAGLDRHRNRVLVGARHRFFVELEAASIRRCVSPPHLGDLLELDPTPRDEGAVTDDAYAHGSSKC